MKQGDVVWVDFGEAAGSEAAFRRPAVVIQNDRFNESRLRTVIVCPITSNLARRFPGHVALEAGESGLTRPSLVEPWLVEAVDRTSIGEKLGELRPRRLADVLSGLALYIEPG